MGASWKRHEVLFRLQAYITADAHFLAHTHKRSPANRYEWWAYATKRKRKHGRSTKRDPMTASAAITCEGRDVIIASQKKLAETSMMLFSQHPASILPASSSLRRCIETTQDPYRLKALICSIDTDHDDGSPANHVHPSRICTTIRDRLNKRFKNET